MRHRGKRVAFLAVCVFLLSIAVLLSLASKVYLIPVSGYESTKFSCGVVWYSGHTSLTSSPFQSPWQFLPMR